MRVKVKGQTILVTGGAGFIGSHLVDALLAQGADLVLVVDNLFVGSEINLREALARKCILYKDDIELSGCLDYIFERHDIDIVFNCATKALNYSFVNPHNAFLTNPAGTLHLLEHLRRGQFNTLCHFSTSEVYGTAVYEPMDEQHPRNPTTAYAAGKAAADLAVESYVRMFDLDAIIVRPFNNYGPRQNYKGELAGVIPATIKRILQNGAPEIHGTGEQSRDFIYVKDTVDAVVKLYRVLPRGETANVSTNHQITIKEVITAICDRLGFKGELLRKTERPADVFTHNASNEKVRSLIDFQLTPFSVGLEESIPWYVEELTGEAQ